MNIDILLRYKNVHNLPIIKKSTNINLKVLQFKTKDEIKFYKVNISDMQLNDRPATAKILFKSMKLTRK